MLSGKIKVWNQGSGWGFVESETVESKAWFIYWSINPDNDSFKGINFSRIFKRIR